MGSKYTDMSSSADEAGSVSIDEGIGLSALELACDPSLNLAPAMLSTQFRDLQNLN